MKIYLKKVLNFGNGYRTFVVAIAMVIVGFYQSDTTTILEGLGLFFLRKAI